MTRPTRIVFWLTLLLAVTLTSGCVMRPVKVESQWAKDASRKKRFNDVLVVGVSPDYNVRCRYESLVVADLRMKGISADASCTYLNSTDPLTVDSVKAVVAKAGNDAALVTELVGRSDEIVEGGDSETRGEAYYKPVGYGYAYQPYYGGFGGYNAYGNFGLPVTYVEFTAEQSQFALESSVVVASNLFDAKTATLVHSIQITAKNQRSRDQVLNLLSIGVTDRLDRDGLLGKRD